ncbi:hypothetical protein K438DRAFT_1795318 [Mycena galopus ATCC 62051]|nr:hypothetical protein K438DRAFT_1795318 [Mycena galopus ATCC 62051]
MDGKRVSASSLPMELWLYIHCLAVSHLRLLWNHTYSNEDVHEYFKLRAFLKAACTLRRVCKLWSELAKELLYETIWVNANHQWPSLYSALERPDIAGLVRGVRLSSNHFENNEDVLHLCSGPRIKVIVQPELAISEKIDPAPRYQRSIPALPALTHIYWVESLWSASQLYAVLASAPNLRHLALHSSEQQWSNFNSTQNPAFPPLRSLQSLNIARLDTLCVHELLSQGLNFRKLTHLSIAPRHFKWAAFPVLPRLRVLSLVSGSYGDACIPFPALLPCCPSLEELQYNAHYTLLPPHKEQVAAKLLCVRLYLEVRSGYYSPHVASEHAVLLLSPTFDALKHVVLYGSGWLADKRMEWPEWIQLRQRGCKVESSMGARDARSRPALTFNTNP